MAFSTSKPISAQASSTRYLDTAAAVLAISAQSLPLGTRAWAEDVQSFYEVRPSATAPHAHSWVSVGPGTIGIDGEINSQVGGLRVQTRIFANDADDLIIPDDHVVIYTSPLAGAPRTISLPALNPTSPGRQLTLKRFAGAPALQQFNLSANVDGAAAALTAQFSSLTIIDTGTGWAKVAEI